MKRDIDKWCDEMICRQIIGWINISAGGRMKRISDKQCGNVIKSNSVSILIIACSLTRNRFNRQTGT